MNSITPFRSPEEKLQVVKALDEMYICQDKRKTDDEIGLIANELMACNYSIHDIITGINSLKSKVYQQIKLRDIKNAIEDRQTSTVEIKDCGYCGGTGMVSLRLSKGSTFAFRCACSNGDLPINRNFPLWQGKEKEYYGNKEYIYPFWEVLKEKSQPERDTVPF